MASVPGQAVDPARVVLSNMMKLYAEGRFCDIRIQIGDEVFECQRSLLAALSQYFNGMFRGNFKESNCDHEDPIILHDIDASAFKEILNSVHAGDLNIDDNNIYALLRANDFLQIQANLHIEQKCLQYIQERIIDESSPIIPNAFDILSFAFLTKKIMLISFMCDHVLDHLGHFAKDAKFMEIPFEILNIILLKFRGMKGAYDGVDERGNILFCSIIRWVNHSRAARKHHRRELINNIDSKHISTDYALSLLYEHEIYVDEAIDCGDNIMCSMSVYNSSIMQGIQFVTGTTCSLQVRKISNMQEETYTHSYRIRDLLWFVEVSHPATAEYISFCTHFEGNCDTCNAEVLFIIVSRKNGVKDLVKNLANTFGEKEKIGFPEFIKWEDVLQEEKGYIKNDTVIFQIRVSF